jgi:iron complex transport system ATP-binding protein
MSGGEARRVMLARVMVTRPDVLVLDEPTSGLDLAARHDFMERVRSVARTGTTLVLVTHHTEEIVPEIGRVLLLKHGRVAGDGPTPEMLTAEHLGHLFDVPVAVDRVGDYIYARPA